MVLTLACSKSAVVVENTGLPLGTPKQTTATEDVELQKQISEIAKEAKGKVGVFAVVIETGESVSLNANERFPMHIRFSCPVRDVR